MAFPKAIQLAFLAVMCVSCVCAERPRNANPTYSDQTLSYSSSSNSAGNNLYSQGHGRSYQDSQPDSIKYIHNGQTTGLHIRNKVIHGPVNIDLDNQDDFVSTQRPTMNGYDSSQFGINNGHPTSEYDKRRLIPLVPAPNTEGSFAQSSNNHDSRFPETGNYPDACDLSVQRAADENLKIALRNIKDKLLFIQREVLNAVSDINTMLDF